MEEPQLDMFKFPDGLAETMDKQYANGAVRVRDCQLLPPDDTDIAVIALRLGERMDGRRQSGNKFLYFWDRRQLLEFAKMIQAELGPKQRKLKF